MTVLGGGQFLMSEVPLYGAAGAAGRGVVGVVGGGGADGAASVSGLKVQASLHIHVTSFQYLQGSLETNPSFPLPAAVLQQAVAFRNLGPHGSAPS